VFSFGGGELEAEIESDVVKRKGISVLKGTTQWTPYRLDLFLF